MGNAKRQLRFFTIAILISALATPCLLLQKARADAPAKPVITTDSTTPKSSEGPVFLQRPVSPTDSFQNLVQEAVRKYVTATSNNEIRQSAKAYLLYTLRDSILLDMRSPGGSEEAQTILKMIREQMYKASHGDHYYELKGQALRELSHQLSAEGKNWPGLLRAHNCRSIASTLR